MVEIEWDGVDLPAEARRSLVDRLRTLASVVDPNGRARLEVQIVGDRSGYHVVVTGRAELRRMGAEVHDQDLRNAIQRAIDLALMRWQAARQRAA